MPSLRSAVVVVVVVAACGFAIPRDARGQATADPGIAVVGVGTAKGKPSVVEISATVSGEGELANDASVKYRDARKKATEALEALKNPSLVVESKGFTVNQAMDPNAQMRMMQGMGAEQGKQKVAVTEQLRIVLKDADKLQLPMLMETVLKLIDVGRDNGLQIGPGNMNYYQMQMMMQGGGGGMAMISFKIPDASALRQEAYKNAVEDARAKANRIAELTGVKLGRILSVQDQDAPPRNDQTNAYWAMMMGMAQQGKEPETGIASNVFGEIALNVRLTVQFEIVK
jgi:uncharacterized protein YggE